MKLFILLGEKRLVEKHWWIHAIKYTNYTDVADNLTALSPKHQNENLDDNIAQKVCM